MNFQNITAASGWIKAALLAALNVSPNDPGLAHEELEGLVVGRDGIGRGAFNDALAQFDDAPTDAHGRLLINSRYLIELMVDAVPIDPQVRPTAALNALGAAFTALENEQGTGARVDRGTLYARCSDVQPRDIDRAIALTLAWQRLDEVDGALRRNGRTWPEYTPAKHHPAMRPSELADRAKRLMPDVVATFQRRGGRHTPAEKPSSRFAKFLVLQKWSGMATWWTESLREMNSLSTNTHASAICVLAGALLEGALVAVSRPAVDAGEWRQQFLKKTPDQWKLGELIEQAAVAGTIPADLKAHAVTLASLRNRIHAGRFAEKDIYNPPYTNEHEAKLAREQLEMLLAAILSWPLIQTLAQPPSAP